jgi:hypothetical protein
MTTVYSATDPSSEMMKTSGRWAISSLVVGLALLALAGCGGGSSDSATTDNGSISTTASTVRSTIAASKAPSTPSSTGAGSAGTLAVTSSIADGSHLAEPVAWTAEPTGGKVDHVDFVIDGTVRWTESKAPYVFNDDGNLLHPYLLGKGPHDLTVDAVTVRGAHVGSTSHVTVTMGPQVAAPLAGTFTRSVVAADVARTQDYRHYAPSTLPTGAWEAVFEPKGVIAFYDPTGSGIDEALRALGDGTLHIDGVVNWPESKGRQGEMCIAEKPGLFRWSISGNALTITGDPRTCADRDSVLVGKWTRKG